MAQFVCPFDGEEFEQMSRFQRHMAAAHPKAAVSAADIEKAIAGIDFPARKRDLVAYATRRMPPGSDVQKALESLPDREYRDAAEVGIGFGNTKAPRPVEFVGTEPPSVRGGRAAATSAVSAAAIAKVLGGIDFPRSKAELLAYARRHRTRVEVPDGVLSVLTRLPDRTYTSMADVEVEVGKLL